MSAGVEAEGPRGAKIVSIGAGPHGWIVDENVGIRIAHITNRVPARRGAEFELAGVGAYEDVAVIRAAAAVVDAEGVADRDLATRGSALAGFCGF